MNNEFKNEKISEQEANISSNIIYKSNNTSFLYILIEIALIILFIIGIYNILSNIKDAIDYMEYKTGASLVTNAYAEDYYITFSKWKYTDGNGYVHRLIVGIIFTIVSIILTIVNLKILNIVKNSVVTVGIDYIEAQNHKEHLVAYYEKEIVVAVKNPLTVTIATQDKRIDVPHLLSVYNIVKIANKAIETKKIIHK